jgi:hypothetical protein
MCYSLARNLECVLLLNIECVLLLNPECVLLLKPRMCSLTECISCLYNKLYAAPFPCPATLRQVVERYLDITGVSGV